MGHNRVGLVTQWANGLTHNTIVIYYLFHAPAFADKIRSKNIEYVCTMKIQQDISTFGEKKNKTKENI